MGKRVGWTGRPALTCMHHHVWNSYGKPLCRQGALLSALGHHRWKGGMEGREVQDGRDAHIQLAHSLCTRNSHNTVRELSAVVQSLCMSNSLQPCGPQQARLLCSSPSPGVCSNSGPLSQWCNYTPIIKKKKSSEVSTRKEKIWIPWRKNK